MSNTPAMKESIRTFFAANFSEYIIQEENFRDLQSFTIMPEGLIPIIEALVENENLGVNHLSDVTAVDWLDHAEESKGRFEVIYNLYSIENNHRFLLKVRLPEGNPTIPTLTAHFAGANWTEREVFDLFGVIFEGHPNLTKILTPDDLEGHPLRKDFPLTYEVPHFTWNKDLPPEVIK
jgi:NADH-quinone oxidoreductase subunit C